MNKVWSVLGADTDGARTAIKNAGCTHAVINATWEALQPTGTGNLNSTATSQLLASYTHARSIGLKPILSINLHYAPTWVLNSVEKFKDQDGNEYTNTNASGKNVRNWMWTQSGRTYVADFVNRVAAALGTDNIQATDGYRLGGGWYGEVHYPQSVSGGPTYAWQAFGSSMQTGVDLASGMSVCPVPGYIPYTGTDAQDVAFLNWYLNGIVAWVRWEIDLFKTAGMNHNLWVLLPGWGIRTNQDRSSTGYKSSAAVGEDHIRVLGEIMHDSCVWPYSTWLNNADAFANGDTADSSKSAWKSIYEKSLLRGKHHRLVGENTENETPATMADIFASALGANSYPGTPGIPDVAYYQGCLWLNYSSLSAGGSQASLADYATNISAS